MALKVCIGRLHGKTMEKQLLGSFDIVAAAAPTAAMVYVIGNGAHIQSSIV